MLWIYSHNHLLVGHLGPDEKLLEYPAANSGASSSIIPSYLKSLSEIWSLWSVDAPSHSSENLYLILRAFHSVMPCVVPVFALVLVVVPNDCLEVV